MPSPERSSRHQAAVLFAFDGNYDAKGQPEVGQPEQITIRWLVDPRQKTDPLGNTVAKSGKVVVDQVIAVGSVMWLGELSYLYGTGSGLIDEEFYEVVGYNDTPDLKARYSMKVVTLMRKHDFTLPAVSDIPEAAYVTEDEAYYYVTEDGDTFYVPSS